jgi:hypothetical protein
MHLSTCITNTTTVYLGAYCALPIQSLLCDCPMASDMWEILSHLAVMGYCCVFSDMVSNSPKLLFVSTTLHTASKAS